MQIVRIAVLAIILPTSASAQELTQRPVRTEKITSVPASIGLYEIGPDGTVLIDWRAVEAAADGPADRMSAPMAKVMLAIRNNKWKSPLGQRSLWTTGLATTDTRDIQSASSFPHLKWCGNQMSPCSDY